MLKPKDRRVRILLVSRNPFFLGRWMDLCAYHHCSTFHVAPRLDGLFRNLAEIDFDIAILSSNSSEELGSALDYLEEVSPDCIVITCSAREAGSEDATVHSATGSRVITPPSVPAGDEEALTRALQQVYQKRA